MDRVPLFRDLQPDVVRTVAQQFGVKTVERGDFVFLENDRATSLNVLAEGRVKLIRETDEGRGLQSERVERRLARALLRLADRTGTRRAEGIELGVPLARQDLAELAGTTLGTASRTLSAWDQHGIIASARERVTILRPHALVAIAEDLPTWTRRPTHYVFAEGCDRLVPPDQWRRRISHRTALAAVTKTTDREIETVGAYRGRPTGTGSDRSPDTRRRV